MGGERNWGFNEGGCEAKPLFFILCRGWKGQKIGGNSKEGGVLCGCGIPDSYEYQGIEMNQQRRAEQEKRRECGSVGGATNSEEIFEK